MDQVAANTIAQAIKFLGVCLVRAAALRRPINTDARNSLVEITEQDAIKQGVRVS